jgi:hypothetical protein
MTPAGRRLVAYRQTHDQTNAAVVLIASLAEFGLATFDADKRGQELVVHGLIQRGAYVEDRGTLIANALRYAFDREVPWQTIHDVKRTAQVQEHLRKAEPGYELRFPADLGPAAVRPVSIEADFSEGSLVWLIEARHAFGKLPLHVLLARRDGAEIVVMNSGTGHNYRCTTAQLSDHLNTPPQFGAVAFAGGQYMHTGVAILLNPPSGHKRPLPKAWNVQRSEIEE